MATYTGKLAESETQMSQTVGKLKAGMYFVRFRAEDGKTEVKKFIKTN